MSLAHEIVELFEQLLEEKGIEVPCSDEAEESERHEGGNVAKLYGMEYAKLVDKVEELLAPETDTDEEMLVKKTVGGRNRIKDAPGILCSETCERFTNCDTCPIQKAIDKLAEYEQQEKREKKVKETMPAAMFNLDMSKKPAQIAMHQVKNKLLCLTDECNSARIKALNESKIYSEVQLHASMQHIYATLIKLLPDK